MIIIPMGGLSKRFTERGFNKPKFMLEMQDRFVFDYAILSFEHYFNFEVIRFIIIQNEETNSFIKTRCEALGLKKFEIVQLPHVTLGQADTVFQGIQDINDERLLIFNIDTFNFGFRLPEKMESLDGSLECFKTSGDQWSFVLPRKGQDHLVDKTAEKSRISDLCSTGFYHFKSARLFKEAFLHSRKNNLITKGEYYIAPLYNFLVSQGKKIGYFLNDQSTLFFCGTPEEYVQCLKTDIESVRRK